MGLDGVEIVMAIEDAFGIAIDDDEASRVCTVQDLCDLVTSRIEAAGHGPVMDALFYRLRRALMETLGVARQAVRPHVLMDDLVPMRGRQAAWETIGRSLDLPLPPLRRPGWMERAIALGAAAPVSGAVLSRGEWPSIIGWSVAGAIGAWGALWATRDSAVHVPSSCVTAGDTVKDLLARHYAAAARLCGRYHPSEVFLAVRRIVSVHLDVPEERVRPASALVADLGMD